MNDFRFSPRANRAHEIPWLPWSPVAFERAHEEGKPILLSISAIWCHWCHVMDETTYSDADVIADITQRFVPVRVDNDERPDVNARYNMGGWPTTAFLSPQGALITGATYLPAAQMRRALIEVSEYYAQHVDELAQQVDPGPSVTPNPPEHTAQAFTATIGHYVCEDAQRLFDPKHGGFGDAPKFPHTDLLDYLLTHAFTSDDRAAQAMLATTLRGMADGGTYDHIEGGFFRYSTTADWSVPHFEKMAEDHGALLRILAQFVIRTEDAPLRETLRSAATYVRDVLFDAHTALFAGSQDADEVYFALAASGRKARGAPFVDRTSYSNWTTALAGAFTYAALALDDLQLARDAVATLDTLHETLRDSDGLLFHVVRPGQAPRVRGLFTDQSAYVRALLDAHEHTGQSRFLERAAAHARLTLMHFASPGGACYDRIAAEATVGRLAVADRPLPENAAFADSLLRLATMLGDAALREAAQRLLGLYLGTYDRIGIFAAGYARAVERLLQPPTSLVIHGEGDAVQPFILAARQRLSPLCVIHVEPEDGSGAWAHICIGTTCGAPIRDATRVCV